MKPLQDFREDTVVLSMLLKPIKLIEVLFIYWFVGCSREMDVGLVSATPLINGVLNLNNNISNDIYFTDQ